MTANVKVYKYDGSVQCEPQSGVPLGDMQRQLDAAGIVVACAQKGHDGQVRITLCGAQTGIINVYSINHADLDRAIALGFASIENLPGHLLDECR